MTLSPLFSTRFWTHPQRPETSHLLARRELFFQLPVFVVPNEIMEAVSALLRSLLSWNHPRNILPYLSLPFFLISPLFFLRARAYLFIIKRGSCWFNATTPDEGISLLWYIQHPFLIVEVRYLRRFRLSSSDKYYLHGLPPSSLARAFSLSVCHFALKIDAYERELSVAPLSVITRYTVMLFTAHLTAGCASKYVGLETPLFISKALVF